MPSAFKFCGSCGAPVQQKQPSPPAASAPASPTSAAAALVLIRPDGSEGQKLTFTSGSLTIGRDLSDVFAQDAYLSPTHATVTVQSKGVRIRDENSLNGVYWRIKRERPVELEDGAVFRIGQEILRFERYVSQPSSRPGVTVMGSPNPGYIGRICTIIGREARGNAYPILPEGIHLGRERGEVVFPTDGYVSGLHCRIHAEGSRVYITDVGSSNGTFLRVRNEVALDDGALLLMGQQLFRVSLSGT